MHVKAMFPMFVAFVLLMGVIPAGTRAAAPDTMLQKVEGAKTAADHTALAAHYDEMSAAAKASAAAHRKMGEAYKGMPAVTGGKVSGASAMPQHCEALAKSFDEQAKMYQDMAAGERELASAR